MKFISPLISDARNSLGGTTYARNPSGVYARAKKAPAQPRTVSQQANRAAFASAAALWKTLSQSQIKAWNLLASQTPWTDTLGQVFKPSGMQLFTKCQRNLALIGASPVLDPTPNPGTYANQSPLVFTAETTNGILTTFGITDAADDYANFANFILQMTAPFSPTISFVAPFKYRNLPGPVAVGASAAATLVGAIPSGALASTGTARTVIIDQPTPSGAVQSLTLSVQTLLATPQTITIYVLTGTSPTLTRISEFDLVFPALTQTVTYYAERDFAAFNVAAGQYLGFFTGPTLEGAYTAGSGAGFVYQAGTAPTSPQTYFVASPANLGFYAYIIEDSAANAITPALAYIAEFGVPQLGMKIGAKLRQIYPTTGLESPTSEAVAIVTGS